MLANTRDLLHQAQAESYAIGGFNIYNLEGAKAVIRAAEATRSPALLQIHPAAYQHGGNALIVMCRVLADEASAPIAVHLDHSTDLDEIHTALTQGVSSIMADGSHLSLADNIAFVKSAVDKARHFGASVEAELGRISGTEDGLTVEMQEACMTNPDEAQAFVTQTGIDMLAVCIGNVHGKYPFPPRLDFARLHTIRERVDIPLVLHGASGLDDAHIKQAIAHGICKFNVNTEVRNAFVDTLRSAQGDLLAMMQASEQAMIAVISEKMDLFGSAGKA
ncbi:MAG: class II fructose-bisphosphate aldolase [Chloroflexota bacterium]